MVLCKFQDNPRKEYIHIIQSTKSISSRIKNLCRWGFGRFWGKSWATEHYIEKQKVVNKKEGPVQVQWLARVGDQL